MYAYTMYIDILVINTRTANKRILISIIFVSKNFIFNATNETFVYSDWDFSFKTKTKNKKKFNKLINNMPMHTFPKGGEEECNISF